MLDNVIYSALTLLGIGIVIFVHELGHFLAARAVGIRVEAFSIGFGPRLIGFRRGGTDYKICAVPLGGFVKMAGEDPTQPSSGASDEFASKTVGQRALVISAGVIMNMIFALVAIPIVFSVGIEYASPKVGWILNGGGAHIAGVRPGDVIRSINGRPVMGFEDVRLDIALAGGDIDLEIERDGKVEKLHVEPKDIGGLLQIGVAPAFAKVQFTEDAFKAESDDSPEGIRARKLKALGLDAQHEIVALNGIPMRYAGAWDDETTRGAVTLRVRNASGAERELVIDPIWKEGGENAPKRIGVIAVSDRVMAVPTGSPAEALGLKPKDQVDTIQGRPLVSWPTLGHAIGAGNDPLREAEEGATYPSSVTMRVFRDGKPVELSLPVASREELENLYWSLVLEPGSPIVRVQKGLEAEKAGMRNGDRITAIDGKPVADFAAVVKAIGEHEDGKGPVGISFLRNGEKHELTVARSTRRNIACDLITKPATHEVTFPFPKSIEVGAVQTGRMTRRVFQTIRSLFKGTVSSKNISGPIGIFSQSIKTLRRGGTYGLLFMAFVSINLAILNILPIPVLDGGWLVFLLIEKIKGSPPSEKMMAAAQWVGLILILALAVFATRNDIMRLF